MAAFVSTVFAVATAYAVCGRIGLLLPYAGAHVTLIWPSIGIALAAIVRWPIAGAVGTFIGAFTINYFISYRIDLALLIALGNTLGPALAAAALRRSLPEESESTTLSVVLRFLGIGVLTMPLFTAMNGTAALYVCGRLTLDTAFITALIWYIGDAAGVLTWASVLLLFPSDRFPRVRSRAFAELVGMNLSALIAVHLLFTRQSSITPGLLVVVPALILPLLWVSIRVNPRLGLLSSFVVVHYALAVTSVGWGPFSQLPSHTGLALCWGLLGVYVLTCLIVGALTSEVRQEREQSARANAELSVALNEARLASAAKDAFLATMSHELRTPLSGIIVAAELLDTISDVEIRAGLCRDMRACGRTLLDTINSVLDFSKLRDGKVVLQPTPARISEIISEAIAVYQPVAVVKGLQVSFDRPDDEPLALVDTLRFRQVLVNLVSNAIKFTEKGRVEIAYRSASAADGSLLAVIRVSDTGPGIDPKHRSTIFQPFSQIDQSEPRPTAGTGLGLSIVKDILDIMDGSIEVRARQGGGTEFVVRLPLTLAPVEPEVRPTSIIAGSSSTAVTSEVRRLSVLLAEDNRVNAKLITRLLEREGCQVVTCENGELALEQARSQTFDVVFMDVQMPVMDGIEATKQIRQRCSRTLPIVGISAQSFEQDRRRCIDAGMSDFLAKPFALAELQRILATLRSAHETRE